MRVGAGSSIAGDLCRNGVDGSCSSSEIFINPSKTGLRDWLWAEKRKRCEATGLKTAAEN